MTLALYAYTVKKLGINLSEQSYDMYDEVLYSGTKCPKLPYGLSNGSERAVKEFDSAGRLHIHGVVVASPSLRYSDVFCRGYHIYMRMLRTESDVSRWRRYMRKAEVTQEAFEEHQRQYAATLERAYFKAIPILDWPVQDILDPDTIELERDDIILDH